MAKIRVERFRVHIAVMVRNTQELYFQPADSHSKAKDLEYEFDSELGLMRVSDLRKTDNETFFIPVANICQFWRKKEEVQVEASKAKPKSKEATLA